ncbi:sensor histidine kinase [Siphonobacter sp. SORGH_AS_1065]|uniref:sensor histidine kinase n=1 Tax=Siphonobacter sp. SORGH_AS_1065 TaxID=3041795 RepID=UPI0027884C4A|nr:sensor histidine kinase [Siphonobacter sp. SORGH_AS_1065]MDQ1090443.1 two-component system LytT family sensor kinase [Siphonobacter sp. SORGH_AS_1065]
MEKTSSLITSPLEKLRSQLLQPFDKTQRKLLLSLNCCYIILCLFYVTSEKLSNGYFVPATLLGVVYVIVGLINFISALYSYSIIRGKEVVLGIITKADSKLDIALRYASMLVLLFMSSLLMLGVGNPSYDSIMGDFAFGHSLIVLVAILLGRKPAFIWFLVVMVVLFYVSNRIGFDYRYHYLTREEAIRYEHALEIKNPEALKRQQILRNEGLNPPTVFRYFNMWVVFILIAFFTAYFFTGISHDIIKMIPEATSDIQAAIEAFNQTELDREREKNLEEEQKMLLKQSQLKSEVNFLRSQLNPHFLYNTLHFLYAKSCSYSEELAEAILKVSDIMRYSLKENSEFVPLLEEVKYIEKYIELHKLRHKELFVDLYLNGNVQNTQIIPFILISLVENAFKHGITNDPMFPLSIKMECSEESFEFNMRNKRSTRPSVDSTHVGLENIRQRLSLTYPSNHSFKVDMDELSFTCYLKVPNQMTS